MTANSPNPVDGDVQALIEHIKEVLQEYEEHGCIGYDESVYRTALAALTAEPVGWRDHESDSGVRWKHGEIFYGLTPHRAPLYTTPPAQLLRPVELPTGYTSGYSSLGSDERFIRKSELIAALRQQGYEVKND